MALPFVFLEVEEEKDEHMKLIFRSFVSGPTRAHIVCFGCFFQVRGRRSARHEMLTVLF